ncbi:hypothetical protein DPMN_091610 [Dreissena polymorpha]|uniref:Uncharacterized protein n=1 Tax=Dreissena polymorpha TaxID=45954 RepID=A0A9D4L0T3_DREPO|nr:hypothetical protein DPMN_091610 [Dreissena polymorpha]
MLECLLTKCGRTDRRRTKTDPRTSPEQYGELKAIVQLVRDINKTNTKNVTSSVFTRKTSPPPGGHIIKITNIFTKFHDDWAKNVTSRVKMCHPPCSHVFQRTGTIFEVNSLFTCFYNIHKEKTAPPTGGHVFLPIWSIFDHVFQRTGTIFELNSRFYKTNVLTKFHEDWTKNVTFRVFTCFPYIHIEKTAPPDGHVFSPIWVIFKLVRDINKTNGLTKFQDERTKMLTCRVFTRFLYSQIWKTAPPTGGHVFQRTGTTFELNQHIIKTNILINFELDRDRTRNVASRVLTIKTTPPTGGHVFQQTGPTFELNQHIIKTNILTIFKLDRCIIGTKFHEDRTRNVASRVFTRKTAPPTGGHVFQRNGTTFELNKHIVKTNILTNFELGRGIIGTNLLTKFHEDRTRNVTSRVFTNQMWTTDGRTTDKDRSQKLT